MQDEATASNELGNLCDRDAHLDAAHIGLTERKFVEGGAAALARVIFFVALAMVLAKLRIERISPGSQHATKRHATLWLFGATCLKR